MNQRRSNAVRDGWPRCGLGAHLSERPVAPGAAVRGHPIGHTIGLALKVVADIPNLHVTRRCLQASGPCIRCWSIPFRERWTAHGFNPLPMARAICLPNLRAPAVPDSMGIRPSLNTGMWRELINGERASGSDIIS